MAGQSWRWLPAAGLLAYLALYGALLALGTAATLRSDVLYNLAAPVAVLLALRAAYRATGGIRWAWLGVGFTALTWGLADGYYTFSDWVLDAEVPSPGLVDVLYYAGYLSFLAAIPVLGAARRGSRDWRSAFDVAAIVVVAGTLTWSLLLEPILSAHEGGFLSASVAAGYPVLDLALLATVVTTAYRGGGPGSLVLLLLSASALAALLSDAGYTYAVVEGLSDEAFLELGWVASYGTMALAATLPDSACRSIALPKLRRGWWLGAGVPYLAVVPLSVLAFRQAAGAGAPLDLLLGCVLAYAIVIARQWLTIVQNTRLQRELAEESARTQAAMGELAGKAEELERLRAEAEFLADHDGLTGLLNHRAWFAKGPMLRPRAVAVLDIDNFKSINDNYGHPAGDVVLRELAVRLRELLPSAILIGRLGGEEFGVLFGVPGGQAAAECQAAVRALSRTPMRLPAGVEVLVTVSAGVARSESTGDPVLDLLAAYERSDALLLKAKSSGRNRLESDSGLAVSA